MHDPFLKTWALLDQELNQNKKNLRNTSEKKKKNTNSDHQIHVDIKAKLNKRRSNRRRMDNNQRDLYKEIILTNSINNKEW